MTDGDHLGVIDQGTTGTRFVVFGLDGRPVASAFTRHVRRSPAPGVVEDDPVDLWESAVDAVCRGLARGDIEPGRLAALGVTNQRQTVLCWERDSGRPVGDAISWQDRRTAERMASLDEEERETIRDRTGLVPDPYFTAPKLEWLLDHGDGTRRRRAADGELCCGTIDAWLLHNLTGTHATDVTNAAQTMLFDIESLRWDADLLDTFGVPEATLPAVRPSSDDAAYGVTDPDGVLGAEIPVTGVLGDQQAALVGQAGTERGDTKVTYGSGNFVLQNTGTEPVRNDRGLLSTVWFQRAGGRPRYALEGPILTAGTVLDWLVDVGVLGDEEETERLARRVDTAGGVAVIPAFAGMSAPYWDARTRGTIVGVTRDTRPGHLVRATIESIGFQTRAVVEALADGGQVPETLLVDGGAVTNEFFSQLQADLLGRRLVRSRVAEMTALGAAYAAGIAIGNWDSLEALRANRAVDRTFEPAMDDDRATRAYQRWTALVEGSRGLYPPAAE